MIQSLTVNGNIQDDNWDLSVCIENNKIGNNNRLFLIKYEHNINEKKQLFQWFLMNWIKWKLSSNNYNESKMYIHTYTYICIYT